MMIKTRVVHVKIEPFDVYIGRVMPDFPEGSKWGNPYRIDVDGDRNECIAGFEEDLIYKVINFPEWRKAVLALDGKRLGCWCRPKACHGDVICKIIDMIKEGKI